MTTPCFPTPTTGDSDRYVYIDLTTGLSVGLDELAQRLGAAPASLLADLTAAVRRANAPGATHE